MARIAYDDGDAAAFETNRHLSGEGLSAWREAVGRHLDPHPGQRLLDLGSGTGNWARAFTSWFHGVEVLAVEPSAAMRARSVYLPVVAGHAAARARRRRGRRRRMDVDGDPSRAGPRGRRARAAPGRAAGCAGADPVGVRRAARRDRPGPVLPGGRRGAGHLSRAWRTSRRRSPRRVPHRRPGTGRADDGGVVAGGGRDAAPRRAHPAEADQRRGIRRGPGPAAKAAATEPGPVVDTLDLLVLR